MNKVSHILSILAVWAIASSVTTDAVPQLINYQGKVYQPSGAPVPDGPYKVAFSIYDVPTGGTALWTETYDQMQVKGSAFHVLLGSINPIGATIFNTADRYLGVKLASDPELSPRQKIASVPYALVAEKAAEATHAAAADIAQTVPDGAITDAKIADGSIDAAKLRPSDFRPDNRLLPPADKLAWTVDGVTYVWHYWYTADFANWTVFTNGGSVNAANSQEGIMIDAGTGGAATYSANWASVAIRPVAGPGRFVARWRTSTNAAGFVALIRCGTNGVVDTDMTSSKGQGFKQVGNTLYAYFDAGLGSPQELHPIADVIGNWQRFLGEIEIDGGVIRYYLNGVLKHTLEIPASIMENHPLGRVSFVAKNAGASGHLEVNWIMKSGWGE